MVKFENWKDAKYPDADTRRGIIDKVVDQNKVFNGDEIEHEKKRVAFSVIDDMRTAYDRYLFRQYYLRDEAIKAIDAGDIDSAKEILGQIGIIK